MSTNALKSAFLQKDTNREVIVKAEELPQGGGGIDYKLSFFEPQVGKSYTIKFIQNIEDQANPLVHRGIYKKLPDPQRKGKTFQFVSSGNAKTCKALDAFFELNNKKKAGDALADLKIGEFFGKTNEAACIIQVLNSPDQEEIGIYRIFKFSTYGPNATVANLISQKVNPTPEQINNGFEKEDIFSIFDSSVMIITCVESTYDGQKGRDFSKSAWAPKQRAAYVELEEGKIHTFNEATDIVNGDFSAEAGVAFEKLIEILQNPQISIHNMFAYKVIGDPLNSEDTEKYLKSLQEKVDEIIPVILNAKTIDEAKNYGKADDSATQQDSAQTIGGVSAADILKESTPEIDGSVLNDTPAATSGSVIENVAAQGNSNQEVDDILNS